MQLIGLSGSVGVGKDSVADYLVAEKGFLKFSFSDALYEEVAAAFCLSKESLLDRDTKEVKTEMLSLKHCRDIGFINALEEAYRAGMGGLPEDADAGMSSREVTQMWGTVYRRAQDPNYWVKRAEETVEAFFASLALYDMHGEIRGYKDAPGLVNTSVRFPNERSLFDKYNGQIWHIYRPGNYSGERESYVSELTLPIETGDRILINNSTLDRLGTATDLMLRGNYIVASQTEQDYAWVPVWVPRDGVTVATARRAACASSCHAPKLGDI
jgi:hypothetical protein